MGIIIPKESSTRPAGSDFGDNIALLPPAIDPPPDPSPHDAAAPPVSDDTRPAFGEAPAASTGPDAYMLHRADFTHRDLPKVSGARDARYQVVYRQSVLDEIHAHGKSSMEAEVCGVLIGEVYFDHLAGWAHVENCIRGNDAVGKQTQVTITSETWTRIHETLEKKYPGKKIIGWYHTHPGFGIFLSGMDLFIQDNFFNQPWQFASVYDPHSGDEGTFVWRAGKSLRENILIENDTGVEPEQAAKTDAVAELTRRINKLERRLDFILTGFLFLVLLALVSPLILMAVMPDAIKKLPILRQPLFNSLAPGDKSAPAADPKTAPADSTAKPGAPKGGTPAAPGAESDDRLLRPNPPGDDAAPHGPKILTPKSGSR